MIEKERIYEQLAEIADQYEYGNGNLDIGEP
jgi:hypothetical protein